MQEITDIREYKTKLRQKYKAYRKNLDINQKEKMDLFIFNKIISLNEYKHTDMLCTYVSTQIEVDTMKLIRYSLNCGKKVAVPKCIQGTRKMDFYFIKDFQDLECATFSVLEPILKRCEKVTDFSDSFFIVPGLCYDMNGYRLGYGKGYYDRFLSSISEYNTVKAGICYCACTVNNLAHGRFDVSSDLLITEKYVKYTGGQNGQQR